MKLISLLFVAIAVLAQVNDNPPVVPKWIGAAPVQFCIDSSMEAYRAEILSALWVWQRETAQTMLDRRMFRCLYGMECGQ